MKYTTEEIRAAMKNGELCAFYQPQYDSISSLVKSAEALVRWIKPDGEIVSPAHFIPVAEETDLVMEIDWYMAEQACKIGIAHV